MSGPAHPSNGNASHDPAPLEERTGPTDISDPLIRSEARKAFVWIGMAALFALVVFLSQSLLVIFGGVVVAALIDGGARVLGKVLKIPRGWRVGLVLLFALAFVAWMGQFAGSQIASQAAELPATLESQFHRGALWLERHGFMLRVTDMRSLAREAISGVGGGIGQVTRMVGGLIGGLTTLFLILVLGIYFALEPRLYRRGLGWMLPQERRGHFEETAEVMGQALRRLLFGRVIGMTVEGLFTWAMLEFYGVPMATLLGFVDKG